MPDPLGSYNLTLEGDAGSWLVGPIFEGGESVRVQASGVIRWSQTGNGLIGGAEYRQGAVAVIADAPTTSLTATLLYTGDPNYVVVRVAGWKFNSGSPATPPAVASVTLDGNAFTRLHRDTCEFTTTEPDSPTEYQDGAVEFWGLAASTWPTGTVVVSLSEPMDAGDMVACSYQNVSLDQPIGNVQSFVGTTSGTVSDSLATSTNQPIVIDSLLTVGISSTESAGPGQVVVEQDFASGGQYHSDQASVGSPGSYLMSWSGLGSGIRFSLCR